MLTLNNIHKTFYQGTVNEKKALSGLCLHLGKGDFVSVIGSNGAGKSTLFNVVAGAFFPDSGEVVINGKNMSYSQEYKRSKYIGRLFQDPLKGTAPNLTIEENLSLAYLRAREKSGPFATIKTKDKELFREKLSELGLGLENRMKNPVGLLSGGQRQALTLLMATLVTPEILLLDEHTAALDPATAEKVMLLTKRIVAEREITCLMITHNITSALEVGNRTIMMDAGNIVLDIAGDERGNMTVSSLLEKFRANANKALDNDRMLLG